MAKPELRAVNTDKPEREIRPLHRNELQLFEFQNATWRATLKGVKKEEVNADFLAVYLSVVADKLRAFDIIHLLADTFYVEVLVRAAEKGGVVQTVPLRVVDLPPIQMVERQALPPGHRIDYDATTHKYRAFRNADNLPLTAELDDWETCRLELVNHNTLKAGRG